jgi:sugar lactone lactonase YvrE
MKPIVRLPLLLALFLALLSAGFAQTVTTMAGGFVGDGGSATQASFQFAVGVVKDRSGNTYVTDEGEQRIRKISSAGIISTYAGTGIAGFSGDGGLASKARINAPISITLDPAGDLVFADAGNERVRKITPTGIISTIAGNGNIGYTGDGGPAINATFNIPWGVAYDSAGNLYISDRDNNVIRKVDTSGIITTYAGNGTAAYCGDNGPATSACLDFPRGITVDSHGNLFIADGVNRRIREVNISGTITTVAGDGQGGFTGDGGQATSAAIGNPRGVAVKNGVLYISNAGQARIRSVTLSTGIINSFIGSFAGYDGDNHAPLSSELDVPSAMIAVSSSAMIFMDSYNARLRTLNSGIVTTTAGGFIGDGKAATAAAMVLPQGIAFDTSGNLYVAEFSANRIRKINTSGVISTVAGNGTSGYSGDGGPATSAQLYFPQAVIVDSSGNLFIADQGNNVIREVAAGTGIITTFSADINFGGGLAFMSFDASQNLYVADAGACTVWKLNSAGAATAVAGIAFDCGYNGDNIKATTALLNSPWGIAFDSKGNLYIADSANNRVRKVNPLGTISTFAGDGTACADSTTACGDGGSPTAAQLNYPISLAVSGATVYIDDELDVKIRKVSAGIINTYAGTGIGGYNGNNLPALSTNLDDPVDVAINPANASVYLVDDVQARVRRVH